MAKDFSAEIVTLYVAQELKMAELYTLFAGRYPELRDFWTSMAEEENRHAASIRELSEKMGSGGVMFNPGRTGADTLQSFLNYLDGIISNTKKKLLPLSNALSLARDVETALIEKKAFEHFRGGTPDVENLLLELGKETARHVERLEDMWRKNRGTR